MKKSPQEKRRYLRYNVPNETALLLYPSLTLSDNLIDISLGGAAFSYREPESFKTGQRILINIIREGISIEDLPAVVTNDNPVGEDTEPERRCGVEFFQVDDEQKEKIAALIEKLTG